MWRRVLLCLGSVVLGVEGLAQSAVDVVRPEKRQKTQQAIVKKEEKRAQQASVVEFRGPGSRRGAAAGHENTPAPGARGCRLSVFRG